jgi:hypothetical protein
MIRATTVRWRELPQKSLALAKRGAAIELSETRFG